jgi:hypothetical protein
MSDLTPAGAAGDEAIKLSMGSRLRGNDAVAIANVVAGNRG